MYEDFGKFFNGDMDDEEFRKEFIKLMNQRQQEMDEFLRKFYGPSDNKSFSGQSRFYDRIDRRKNNNDDVFGFFNKMFNGFLGEQGSNFYNPSDSSMNFYSSSKVFRINPDGSFEEISDEFLNNDIEKEGEPLKVLKLKMEKAIEEERYEDAAKFRDAIKSLENKNKEEN
jgi:hypothetical protein